MTTAPMAAKHVRLELAVKKKKRQQLHMLLFWQARIIVFEEYACSR